MWIGGNLVCFLPRLSTFVLFFYLCNSHSHTYVCSFSKRYYTFSFVLYFIYHYFLSFFLLVFLLLIFVFFCVGKNIKTKTKVNINW